jgi:hypothetical protein
LRGPQSVFPIGFDTRRAFLSLLFVAGTLLPLVPRASAIVTNPAPQPAQAQVSGHVLDQTGALIPGAVVQLTGQGNPVYTATADAGGLYSFAAIPSGAYRLTVSASGFASQTLTTVIVTATKRLSLDLKLDIETAQQNVQVNQNNANDTSPDKNGDAIVIKGSDLDMLSTDTNQMLQQLQGIAGTGGDGSPQLYVDGFSGGTMPPKNTIREIRINDNPFSAEYEEQGFNRIQIFTKPGSDKIHGEAFVFGTDSVFDSMNPYATEPQPFHSYEADADLEGPLGKETSYLLGYRGSQLANSAIVNAVGLNADNAQVAITAAVNNPTNYQGYSVKLDRQLTPNNTLTARIDAGHKNQENAGVGQLQLASQGYNSQSNFTILQIADNQIIGTKIINDAHFQYDRARSAQNPLSTDPALVVEGAETGGGSDLGRITDNQDSYELQDFVTFDLGKHFLRAGIRERLNRDANSSTANYNGEYIFSTLAAYQLTQQGIAAGLTSAQIRANGGGASQFNITAGDPSAAILLADTGAFAEDTWKITKKFTASYGLRFETQNHIADQHDFAPRLAATYNVSGNDKKKPLLVLQGGFGLFYTRFPSADLLEVTRLNGISQAQYVLTSPDTYPAIPTLSALTSSAQTPPTVYRLSSTYHSPYAVTSNFSLQHTFGPGTSVTLGYNTARGIHLLLSRNINAPLPDTYNSADPASGFRPFGTLQNIYQYDTDGVSNKNHLYLNVHSQGGKHISIFANYNFGYSRSDTDGNFPSQQYDVRADYGRDAADNRQRLFLGGQFLNLPGGMSGGTFMIAQSGAPFDIVLGNDLNGDSQFNDRPSFATDLTRPSVVRTRYGNFDTDPIPGQTIIPNNYGQGPGLLVLNSFVEKEFHFGPTIKPAPDTPKPTLKPGQKPPQPDKKYTLFGAVEGDNILNHVNPAAPVGTLGSPLFGVSNALNSNFSEGSANRQILFILGFRF